MIYTPVLDTATVKLLFWRLVSYKWSTRPSSLSEIFPLSLERLWINFLFQASALFLEDQLYTSFLPWQKMVLGLKNVSQFPFQNIFHVPLLTSEFIALCHVDYKTLKWHTLYRVVQIMTQSCSYPEFICQRYHLLIFPNTPKILVFLVNLVPRQTPQSVILSAK